MKKYTKVDVSEQQLEEFIRRGAGLIEEGLVYIDHQKTAAEGRLDVLLVDSGKSLVVAELKVTQDDGMLMQGLDYYDYVSTHLEAFARLYKQHSIDPTQQVRLLLIAPNFSNILLSRCKWLDILISLFTFTCLKLEGEEDVVPIFTERDIAAAPEVIAITNLDDNLSYITDSPARTRVTAFLEEIKNWKPESIALDSIKDAVSMKVNGRVFAYLSPRRKHFIVTTYDAGDNWVPYPINNDDDLMNLKPITKAAMERRAAE